MTIFNEIPANWLRKGAHIEIRPNLSAKSIAGWPTRVLLVGQMLTGTATAATPYPITRADQAVALFGNGSLIEMMCRFFKAANATVDVWAMGVADVGTTRSVRTITITGSPSSAGTIPLYLAGKRLAIAYAATDTPTLVATAIASAVNADVSLPFTATSAAGVVTLSARNAGTIGNSLDVRVGYRTDDPLTPGLTFAIAQTIAGATDPAIASVITALANDWYTDIVIPWTDSATMSALETELARRYTALNSLDMHAYVGVQGTYATATTWSSTRNSAFVTAIPTGSSPLEPPFIWATVLAAIASFHLGNDPARQLGTLPLPGIDAPLPAACFTDTEQNLMLARGLSTWDIMPDGTIALNRVVTSYTRAPSGAADTAWLDIMVPKTLSRIRYDWLNYQALTFPRHKLTDDNSPALGSMDPSLAILTPRSMLGSWIGRARLYQQMGWIEDIEFTKANSSFARDADRNRLNGRMSVKIIGNAIVLAGALEFFA